ncbi:2,3,4,5-tetrahydropyridine-2,6-carboxylate N-succinyltransferase, partial [Campylobacter coli]|nr:2,3,4,5-tetrahydropyridine-2,6-carboxylate N-succinyltransferase [Campylobacter coli]
SKEIYKGIELKGLNGLHFRQDSISGAMIVSLNKKAIKLNEALH